MKNTNECVKLSLPYRNMHFSSSIWMFFYPFSEKNIILLISWAFVFSNRFLCGRVRNTRARCILHIQLKLWKHCLHAECKERQLLFTYSRRNICCCYYIENTTNTTYSTKTTNACEIAEKSHNKPNGFTMLTILTRQFSFGSICIDVRS